MVGKTDNLIDAMKIICGAKFFIGFDGFFSFFAPSQRIPTLQFSHLACNPRMSYDPCLDGCGDWFNYSVLCRPIKTGRPYMVNMYYFNELFSRLENGDFEG
jgi:hypothetical protein